MESNALNALLGKAFSERSEDFSAAQRRESNGIFVSEQQRNLRRREELPPGGAVRIRRMRSSVMNWVRLQ